MEKFVGNDEFILCIRKKQKEELLDAQRIDKTTNKEDLFPNDIRNDKLGKMIKQFIVDTFPNYDSGQEYSTNCIWNPIDCNDNGYGLPKTATQLYIDTSWLSEIYEYLEALFIETK